MEPKPYQQEVLSDLRRFLSLLTETRSTAQAYRTFWEEKGVRVNPINGMPPYRNDNDVPSVCFKVPTGGGKTFLAACSIQPIFDSMPKEREKAVVWLVPSDAILTQTFQALNDVRHPYRRRIDTDFQHRVSVYSKEQLLQGRDFNPSTVREQLSIFVLSYDSFRAKNKEGRKVYQENGNLLAFSKQMPDKSVLLEEIDETALIQVVRSLNPLVIVDESHHATTTLSVEMLRNLNPCFVLELTATPKKRSNILSFVDASQLKKANMVKLPVIVYNRKSQTDVYGDAISIRQKLEAQAKLDYRETGQYIRPIVLFQAQPKNKEDSTTYEKIKNTLLEAGIPAEHIAIKTGNKDELKQVDLLSKDCPIRYIITVNALKEGWDCPFAYILATVANRSSPVEVEQILGRILRLPYTRKNKSNVLNLSYVITSSICFHQTLENIVAGLNQAGFSRKDCRVKDEVTPPPSLEPPEQLQIEPTEPLEEPESPDIPMLRAILEGESAELTTQEIESDPLLAAALQENTGYEEQHKSTEGPVFSSGVPQEVRDKMNAFHMKDEWREEVSALCLPQFMMKIPVSDFFDSEYVPLDRESLLGDFTLRDKDIQIDFNTIEAELYRVDTEDGKDPAPKAWQITGTDSTYLKEWFNTQPEKFRLTHCKGLIRKKISRINSINDRELQDYIDRIVENMTEDQISDMEQSTYPYAVKVEEKVKSLLEEHQIKTFDLLLEQGEIVCRPNYRLPETISPTTCTDLIPKSLYAAEEEMNAHERKIAFHLSGLDNIKWWHRNISRQEFQINGPIHAYPDIIAMTTSGRILMIEPKGDYLDNAESRQKAKIGAKWAEKAGDAYRYYMVFETKSPDYPGACSYEHFLKIVDFL